MMKRNMIIQTSKLLTLISLGILLSFCGAPERKNPLDPKNPEYRLTLKPPVILLGIYGQGIFKSPDGGATWKESNYGIKAYPLASSDRYL